MKVDKKRLREHNQFKNKRLRGNWGMKIEYNEQAIWAYWQIGRSEYNLTEFSVMEYAERLENEVRKGVKILGSNNTEE